MPELSAITAAFGDALTLHSIGVIFGGVLLGYLVGVIPGLNRSVVIAIAIPLNTPGEPSSAATCLDGYPMAKNGQPRKALKVGLLASVIGDLLATLLLIVVVIPFASIALKFGSYELAAVLIFALVFIARMAGGSF